MQLPIRSLLLSPSGRVAQGAERGQFQFRLFFQALSLLIFLAKKFAKLSAATRLPLACIKFSATTRLHLGGKLCRKAAVMRGSFISDKPFGQRISCFSLWESLPNCRSKTIPASRVASVCEPIAVRSFLPLPGPAARNAIRKPFCPTFILA